MKQTPVVCNMASHMQLFSILTKTSENGHHVWGTVIYREFNTNMTFKLKSKVKELTLILFHFYCTENRKK